ncbi:MAG: hypothetical protein HYR64_00330 [Fimbriimonas ginsengisoli]|uniref:Uncharacterized protein n=1 Tax=Fimbriimonas ginsengisoli TaxID=1005039 RepID=A0A931LQJ2_FIMGI|nr:hypothetical protein [Fimbriimonas ginsengisoli]
MGFAAGCGGGGGAAGPVIPPPGAQLSSAIPDSGNTSKGNVDVYYLTGQGRLPTGNTAVITHQFFVDPVTGEIVDQASAHAVNLQLDAYTANDFPVLVPVTSDSRSFDKLPLEINSLLDTAGGVVAPPVFFSDTFPANVRVEPGRHTTVSAFLDDSMIDNSVSPPTFLTDQFVNVNLTFPGKTRFDGWFSDFVRFDISALGTRPALAGSGNATAAFFSGDRIAIGGAGAPGEFDMLDPLTSALLTGTVTAPVRIGSRFAPGTYTTRVPDPRDVLGSSLIDAESGFWRDFTDVVANSTTFEVITFPNATEDPIQDMVLVQRNGGGTIIALYSGKADLFNLAWTAYPISQVFSVSPTNPISGTLSGLLDKTSAAVAVTSSSDSADVGLVRSGHWTKTSGTAPAGFPTNGRFIVFRQ